MATVSGRQKDQSTAAPAILKLYDDALLHVLHFLNGKSLARLQSVCKQMNTKKDSIESVAHSEFLRNTPGFAYLSNDLLQQHIRYTDMKSGRWTYLYHLIRCRPTIQDIPGDYRDGDWPNRGNKTNWNNPSHIVYFNEKLFGKGNVILMVNTLRLMKRNKLWSQFDDDGVPMFLEWFLRYGSLLGDIESNKNMKREDRKRFRVETQLHLLKHHRDVLPLKEEYDAVIHLLMLRAITDGDTYFAVEFRKLGAILKSDLNTSLKWESLFQSVGSEYWNNWIWLSFRAPGYSMKLKEEELNKRFEALIKVFSIGTFKKSEKLQHMDQLLMRNEFLLSEGFSMQQKCQFVGLLLKVGAVSESIRPKAELWLRSQA